MATEPFDFRGCRVFRMENEKGKVAPTYRTNLLVNRVTDNQAEFIFNRLFIIYLVSFEIHDYKLYVRLSASSCRNCNNSMW